jgi:hypothetical protein
MPQEAVYVAGNQPFSFGVTRSVFEGEGMAIVLYELVVLYLMQHQCKPKKTHDQIVARPIWRGKMGEMSLTITTAWTTFQSITWRHISPHDLPLRRR